MHFNLFVCAHLFLQWTKIQEKMPIHSFPIYICFFTFSVTYGLVLSPEQLRSLPENTTMRAEYRF